MPFTFLNTSLSSQISCARAPKVLSKYPLLAPDQTNIDAIVKFVVVNYAGYFSVANMTTAIEELHPQLVWLTEPWRAIQKPPRKPPAEPEKPLGPWDAARLRDEANAEAEKSQHAKQKLIDAALKKKQAAEADPFPPPVYYPGGGKVNHGETAKLRKAWAARHPETKK